MNADELMADELIALWERRYVENIVAMLNSGPESDSDYWRWSGHAAQLRDCLTDLHLMLGRPVPGYGSREWRTANGVTR
jgi:hypothetical protein